MEETTLVSTILFFGIFLVLIGLLKTFSKKISFPYTILLLFIGFLAQFIFRILKLEVGFELTPDIIFFVLLPLLLFESSSHINLHQFKIQFKTITFLATFGLMLSVATVTFVVSVGLGLPWEAALLFGSIISATDPIAVLSIFKSLGAPKRLGLIADGESMFNDATAVILFKVSSGIIAAQQLVGNSTFNPGEIFSVLGQLTFTFIASLILGFLMGYGVSKIIEKIDEDRLVETTLTVALAIGSFVIAEHFLHISGVIATVAAGITLGNLGKTKISRSVASFIHEFWEYIGFVSLSIVFFFTAYNLNIETLLISPFEFLVIIFAVILGRIVSVYGSFFVSNRFIGFKDEPNIPMSWQHILMWGGLRGVIPLVLAYGISPDFQYRDLLISYTLVSLLFSLFVNGMTVKWLLVKLNLHIPPKEESLTKLENRIFELEEARNRLKGFSKKEFKANVIRSNKRELIAEEQRCKKDLNKIIENDDFLKCIKLQTLSIERKSIGNLYKNEYINERVLANIESEIDLQHDAVEYPEVYSGRAISDGGLVDSKGVFKQSLIKTQSFLKKFPILSWLFKTSKDEIILDRISVLNSRVISSKEVTDFLDHTISLFEKNKKVVKAIKGMIRAQKVLIEKNEKEIQKLTKKYPRIITQYQDNIVHILLDHRHLTVCNT